MDTRYFGTNLNQVRSPERDSQDSEDRYYHCYEADWGNRCLRILAGLRALIVAMV
jgi:hypothetical protein